MEEPRQRGELAEASPLFHKENDKKLRNEEKLCRIFDFALLSRAERSIIIPGRLGEQHYS